MMEPSRLSAKAKPSRLWNKNFFLLWQGQLVSLLGDRIYQIAMGFWILELTDSKTLMGLMMASAAIPAILLAPLAGAIVDRSNRKVIMVSMDLVRGIGILGLGFWSLSGDLPIWLIFAVSIVLSLAGTFFNPAIASVLPDLVPAKDLSRANSMQGMSDTGTSALGNPLGGLLYTLIGAPLLFVANGVSYLLSAFTELFIDIPLVHKPTEAKKPLWADMKEGVRFVWGDRGLRYHIIGFGGLAFLSVGAIIMLMPLFHDRPDLDAADYGYVMTALTAGMFAGFAVTSGLRISHLQRRWVFLVAGTVCMGLMATLPYLPVWAMYVVLPLAGASGAWLITLIRTAIQLYVPADKRGKVFSLLGSITMSLAPASMIISGILADAIGVGPLFTGGFAGSAFFILWLGTRAPFIALLSIEGEPEPDEDDPFHQKEETESPVAKAPDSAEFVEEDTLVNP